MVFIMSDAGLKKTSWNIAAHLSMPAFAYLYPFLCSYAFLMTLLQVEKERAVVELSFVFFTQENDVNGKEVWFKRKGFWNKRVR